VGERDAERCPIALGIGGLKRNIECPSESCMQSADVRSCAESAMDVGYSAAPTGNERRCEARLADSRRAEQSDEARVLLKEAPELRQLGRSSNEAFVTVLGHGLTQRISFMIRSGRAQ
jgi:hypothetical protein